MAADLLKEMLARFSKITLNFALVRRISQNQKAAYQGKDWLEFKATGPQGLLKRVSALSNRHWESEDLLQPLGEFKSTFKPRRSSRSEFPCLGRIIAISNCTILTIFTLQFNTYITDEMCLKQCATSCLDKSRIAKRVGNLTNKKMVHIYLLDYRLSDQTFRNRCANRMYRESERHVKVHVKLSFLSTLSLRVFLDGGNFLFNLLVLLFQSSSITKYMRSWVWYLTLLLFVYISIF